MKRFLLFAALILLLNASIAAYTISGSVKGGNAITVNLTGDAAMTTTTDTNGFYQFTGLAAGGSYTITPKIPVSSLPRLTLTNPLPNSTVQGSLTVSADTKADICSYSVSPYHISFSALDGDKENQNFQLLATSCCNVIIDVSFYIDNNLVYSDTTPGQMCQVKTSTFLWDTTQFSNGVHTLKITVTDDRNPTVGWEIPVTVNNSDPQLTGDVNHSGTVDIVDALLTAQYSVGLNPANFYIAQADTNCNGTVDIIDALLIAQYFVGLFNQFCP